MAWKNKKTKGDPEVQKLVYMMIKDVGICGRCRSQWAEKGHVCCHDCILRMREQHKLSYKPKNMVERYKKVATISIGRKKKYG